MHAGERREKDVVEHLAISGAAGEPDEDDVVADTAVVGDVGGVHKHAVIADHGLTVGLGSGVDGAPFAENVVVTDLEVGFCPGDDCVVLRRLPEGGERVDHIAGAERGVAVDVAMTDQAGSGADLNVRADIAEGTDFHAVIEDGAVCDDCGGMNFRHTENLSCSED